MSYTQDKEIALRVEGLSKMYRIGFGSSRADNISGKLIGLLEKPFKWLIEQSREPREEEVFWALKNISFEIYRGDVVGFIGHNGAGKSTLLKILSRITEPSRGFAEVSGRLSALLEVGTGMHPELTGRENIYMNGTILGMKKREIDIKFDEIVEFSGVSKFLDTPVKHYSSGMRVRLGFSIAAHLEPDILIVDEVLTVGDADFQSKSLGKMKEVAKGGRTVLFVSHNMAAVKQLCNRAVVLNQGELVLDSRPEIAIDHYLRQFKSSDNKGLNTVPIHLRKGNGIVRLLSFSILDSYYEESNLLLSGRTYRFKFDLVANCSINWKDVEVGFTIVNNDGYEIASLDTLLTGDRINKIGFEASFNCVVPRLPLIEGGYYIFGRVLHCGIHADWLDYIGDFTVEAGDFYKSSKKSVRGLVMLNHHWE